MNLHAPLSCFITGTDTEIGKTLLAAALLRGLADRGLRTAALKPIAAGAFERDGIWCNEDVDQLAAAATITLPLSISTPYLLKEAVAPHIAAAHAGITLDIDTIVGHHRDALRVADVVVVEGVGGFRVPLSGTCDTADLALALRLPVVLVVGMRLGCINHALLTADAIAARGLPLAGWIANHIDPSMRCADENLAAIQLWLMREHRAPLLGRVAHLALPTPEAAAAALDLDLLLAALRAARIPPAPPL